MYANDTKNHVIYLGLRLYRLNWYFKICFLNKTFHEKEIIIILIHKWILKGFLYVEFTDHVVI